MSWRDFKKYWVPVVLYAGFIFYVSSIPSPVPATRIDLSVLHVPMFFALSYLIARAASAHAWAGERTAIATAILFTAAYGVLDELHQLYVPGRTFSYLDIGFDLLGGCLIVFKPWWEKLFERVNL
jgi:VanZ family protein